MNALGTWTRLRLGAGGAADEAQDLVPGQPLVRGDVEGVADARAGCRSRPMNARAKSSAWVSVQSDVPSPWTTTGLPRRMRSTIV